MDTRQIDFIYYRQLLLCTSGKIELTTRWPVEIELELYRTYLRCFLFWEVHDKFYLFINQINNSESDLFKVGKNFQELFDGIGNWISQLENYLQNQHIEDENQKQVIKKWISSSIPYDGTKAECFEAILAIKNTFIDFSNKIDKNLELVEKKNPIEIEKRSRKELKRLFSKLSAFL